MAYLSRVWLNPLRNGAQRLLQHPQSMHAAVLGGLAEQPVTERVLWRLEADGQHRMGLLVLTQSRPSWEHIVEQAGWPGADDAEPVVKDYGPLLKRVVAGSEFAFRLRANTVTSTRTPQAASTRQRQRLAADRPRGVRVPQRTAAQQLDWFLTHLPGWGLAAAEQDGLVGVRLVGRERVVFRKGAAGGDSRPVTLQTATAEGLATVVDPDVVRTALLSGCGPARAYGCGLLTLAPATRA